MKKIRYCANDEQYTPQKRIYWASELVGFVSAFVVVFIPLFLVLSSWGII